MAAPHSPTTAPMQPPASTPAASGACLWSSCSCVPRSSIVRDRHYGPVRRDGALCGKCLSLALGDEGVHFVFRPHPCPSPARGRGVQEVINDANGFTLLPPGEGAQRADEGMRQLRRAPSPLPLSRRRERGSSNSGDAHGFYPSPFGRRCPAGG